MSQTWNPERYARAAAFVSEMGTPLIHILAPKVGERILDLGCGDGTLARELMALGCEVVGVDASPEMVKAARGVGVDARAMNGERLSFEGEFDTVFSNAALHWMTRPDEVIEGVVRALKPRGRFVGEMGAQGNIASVIAALERSLRERGLSFASANPWYFPAPEEYRSRLEAASFHVIECRSFARPTPLRSGLRDWLETFAVGFLSMIQESERGTFLNEIVRLCAPDLLREGTWTVDYVRLRFFAVRA